MFPPIGGPACSIDYLLKKNIFFKNIPIFSLNQTFKNLSNLFHFIYFCHSGIRIYDS